jgi:hypothetical protein
MISGKRPECADETDVDPHGQPPEQVHQGPPRPQTVQSETFMFISIFS